MYSLICIGAKVIKWRIESLFSNCNGNNQIFIWGRKWAITLTLHDTQNLTAIKIGNLTKSKTIKLFKRKYRGKYLWPFDMERFPIQEVKSIKQREEKNQWNELHENFKCLLFKGHKLKENICNTYLTKAYMGDNDVDSIPGPKTWKLGTLRAGEGDCPISSKKGKLHFSLPFCSLKAFNRLSEAHPQCWGQSSLPSLQSQMPISSRNTLTKHSEVIFYLLSVHPLAQSYWH